MSEYTFESEVQYELSLNKDDINGKFVSNPNTFLTRSLGGIDTNTPFRDYSTITVNSTLGFPDQGVVFINQEAIHYTRKTPNQFLDCTRGQMGVTSRHEIYSNVYGPYYVELTIVKDDVTYTSRSWPKGLVESFDVKDGGLLCLKDDEVRIGLNGILDPREQILCTIKQDDVFDVYGYENNLVGAADNTAIRVSGHDPYVTFTAVSLNDDLDYTFIENYDDLLVSQAPIPIADGNLKIVADRTFGVDSVYFDDDHVFVSSSGFPSYTFGEFNEENAECPVGRHLRDDEVIAIIPRRHQIKENNYFEYKGTDTTGIFVDGVRLFSNVSPNRVTQGTVGSYEIIDGGKDYVTPTLLVDGVEYIGMAVVDLETGVIIDVERVGNGSYTSDPVCEVTSGRGAVFSPSFDRFGRITSIAVTDGGEYYKDRPVMQAVDGLGKGRGALLSCEVEKGKITKVNIINHGIDYDSKATEIIAKPIGSGAKINAIAQYYEVNRPGEILTSPCGYKFDQGNGFLYERPGTVNNKTTFGYTVDPVKISSSDIDVLTHSPLIGWAFDGNPIYGPYGYANNYDSAQGFERQESAYVLRGSRRNIIPAKSDVIGTDPPSVIDYDMGYFVQDYEYSPDTLYPQESYPGMLATEDPKYVNTEKPEFIEIEDGQDYTQVYPNRLLDENNGKICNTPEFPQSLYPDGVYCYFVTMDDQGEPAFPYVIGKTFHNRPISQVIDNQSAEKLDPINRSIDYSSTIEQETPLVFDVQKLERLREPSQKAPDRRGIELELSSLSEGYIKDVVIQDETTPERSVGDLLYIDNTGTSGGGAQAIVKSIKGKKIYSGNSQVISYKILPHIQVVDLMGNVNSDGQAISFTLNKDYTTKALGVNGASTIKVVDYIQGSAQLIIETMSFDVPVGGEYIYDQKGRRAVFGDVQNLRTPRLHTTLWLDHTEDLHVGDILLLPSEEQIKVLQIFPDNKIIVDRGFESDHRFIEDGFSADQRDKYYFNIGTDESHGLRDNDVVTLTSFNEELNGDFNVRIVSNSSFRIFIKSPVSSTAKLSYTTQSESVTGFVGDIELTSPGYGYSSLPVVKGIYNRMIDRAIVKPVMGGNTITGYEVEYGGARYSENAIAIITDFTGNGSGAVASVNVEGGVVTSVTSEDIGTNYVEPIVYIVEPEGKYLLTTDTIGKINSLKIINPGRDINIEGSGRPEILAPTRVIVKYRTETQFFVNEEVFQGAPNLMTATARVVEIDPERQMITLDNITGFLSDQELLYSTNGCVAEVLTEGDSHIMVKVDGVSSVLGRFIDDKSLISESYAVIQDSYRYQWFSYVISSDVRKIEYDTFVEKLVHPSGFVRFGDLTLRSGIKSSFKSGNEDSQVTLGVLDKCEAQILIVGQNEDLPVLAVDKVGQDNFILVHPNLCGSDTSDDLLINN